MSLYDRSTGKTNQALFGARKKSFADIGQNLHIIARRLLQNEDLLKLLVHSDNNALDLPLTSAQKESAFGDQVRIVPIVEKSEDIKNYVIIQFGGFSPQGGDSALYKGYFLSFDIICNVDNWMMNDYTPRPYKIMAEIDKEIGQTKLDSLGPVVFAGANNLVINEEMSGFTLIYSLMSEI